MQLDSIIHFNEIVLPAINEYDQAEEALSRAACNKTPELVSARYTALRHGASAAIFLHHFADIVAHRPPGNIPDFEGDVGKVRQWLKQYGADDVNLLRDVADALKHAVLNPDRPRDVPKAEAVIAIGRAYGAGRYGEGKFGGTDEVWIFANSGQRALSAILWSVRDAWTRALAL